MRWNFNIKAQRKIEEELRVVRFIMENGFAYCELFNK